ERENAAKLVVGIARRGDQRIDDARLAHVAECFFRERETEDVVRRRIDASRFRAEPERRRGRVASDDPRGAHVTRYGADRCADGPSIGRAQRRAYGPPGRAVVGRLDLDRETVAVECRYVEPKAKRPERRGAEVHCGTRAAAAPRFDVEKRRHLDRFARKREGDGGTVARDGVIGPHEAVHGGKDLPLRARRGRLGEGPKRAPRLTVRPRLDSHVERRGTGRAGGDGDHDRSRALTFKERIVGSELLNGLTAERADERNRDRLGAERPARAFDVAGTDARQRLPRGLNVRS